MLISKKIVYTITHITKLSKLEDAEKQLETLKPIRIKSLHRHKTTKKMSSVIKNFQTKKSTELDDVTCEFFQTFK